VPLTPHLVTAASPIKENSLDRLLSPIRGDEVHIWTGRSVADPAVLDRFRVMLCAAEMARADALKFARHRHEFVSSHALLRMIAGAHLGVAPGEVRFGSNLYGRPRILNPTAEPLHFSLSHSDGLIVIALSKHESVGIDVERIRPIAGLESVARSHFTESETSKLEGLADFERLNAFFRCWTRKEAFVKATGLGMSLDFHHVEVSLLDDEKPAILACAWDDSEPGRWRMAEFIPQEGFVACVAAKVPKLELRFFEGSEFLQ
jgi:4'-phosphopantetheinyl transferase